MLPCRQPGRAGAALRSAGVARPIRAHRLACRALPWQQTAPDASQQKVPRPNDTFSREDIRRIKEHGPTIDDVTITLPSTTYNKNKNPDDECEPSLARWLHAAARPPPAHLPWLGSMC